MDHDAIVLGGGPAGISAALWCRRLNLRPVLLERAGELGGQALEILHPVTDYLGLEATDGRALIGAFAAHLARAGVEVRCGWEVRRADLARRRVEGPGGALAARALVIATGARPRRLGVPGEAEMIARGEVYRGSRDGPRFAGRRVAVVGGGDRALQNALLLAGFGAEVTLVHRSERFRARPEFMGPARAHPRIRLLRGARVTRIAGAGRVEGVEVALAGETMLLPVEAVFVYIGTEPNSELFRGQLDLREDGRVAVDAAGRTSVPRVYAAGDVCAPAAYASITSAVGQGMVVAKALALDLMHQD